MVARRSSTRSACAAVPASEGPVPPPLHRQELTLNEGCAPPHDSHDPTTTRVDVRLRTLRAISTFLPGIPVFAPMHPAQSDALEIIASTRSKSSSSEPTAIHRSGVMTADARDCHVECSMLGHYGWHAWVTV